MTLASAVRGSWHQFLEAFEGLRPELYRYCRHLTRSPWDAEDLAQDVLARAFVTLGKLGAAPPNPRAWLFRVASNAWIDQQRRLRPAGAASDADADTGAVTAVPDPRATREAAGTLISRLAPQERAAVVLKDVFDLSLDEIAEALTTTPNAVKAALHRGRGKLVDEPAADDRVPTPAALDAFVAAFERRDLEAVRRLLLETSTVEVVGVTTEYGNQGGILWGMMFGSERLAEAATRGGIEARFVQGALPAPPRREVRVYRGEPIVLAWYAHADGEHVRAIDRVELDGDHVVTLRDYFFTSDVLAEVCAELGVSYRINGYKFWLEGC
jgi:RNA polymerase sigma-70 factor (ECF subfamily)